MELLKLLILLLFNLTKCQSIGGGLIKPKTHNMIPGNKITIPENSLNELLIFCFHGHPKTVMATLKAAYFRLDIQTDDYSLFLGQNETEVKHLYDDHISSWFNILPWKSKTVYVSPFNLSCLGIVSDAKYSVEIRTPTVDPLKIIYLCIGFFLFLYAKQLSHNQLLYYSSGIVCGILASTLIVTLIISRLIPMKKYSLFGLIIGGSSVALYLLQYIWYNLKVVMTSYQKAAMLYILIVGVISFGICYKKGPITDERTHNLIKWTLMFIGLTFIYFSSWYQEMSVAVIIILVLSHVTSCFGRICTRIKEIWRRRFPPKHKFLTESEYEKQGEVETQKALEELQKYYTSPKFSPWKAYTMFKPENCSRLSNFALNGIHLTREEILDHSIASDYFPEYTDDESDDN